MKNTITPINTSEDLKKLKDLKYGNLIQFTCRRCSKRTTIQWRPKKYSTIKRLLCRSCGREVTNIGKYGSISPLGNKKVQEKAKRTLKRRYGVDNSMKLKETRDKFEKTMEKRYGVKNALESKAIYERAKQRCIENYGVDNPMKSKKIQERAKNAMIDKYGVPYCGMSKELYDKTKATKNAKYGNEYYSNSDKMRETNKKKYGVEYIGKSKVVRDKIEATNFRKYGVKCVLSLPEIQEKIKATNNAKYGVDCLFKHPEIIKRSHISRGRRKYLYDGEKFDSSWEMALWIYAKDHGEDIERVEEPLTYTVNGKTHFYFPDFKYKGQLVEVKGDHFINEIGNMINPYDDSLDDVFDAKYKCALEHGVKFMFEKDIQFAIDYVENKFDNKKFYKSFIINPLPPPQLNQIQFMPMYIYPTIPMMLPWWMFMTPCDFTPYSNNVFEREGMEFVDCE